MQPTSAIIAVTLNCNAHCVMCDIYKNRMTNEMRPEEYASLPRSLRDINVSGGEPFLREDLPAIIRVFKQACPEARLVISTNGFLPERIDRLVRESLAADPALAVRVSIDGLHGTHDEVRGIPGGFERCRETLGRLRAAGVTDLGVGFTLLERNLAELPEVYRWSRQENLQFSVTIATDSPIFFGEGKEALRPGSSTGASTALSHLARQEYRRLRPIHWLRGWYADSLAAYVEEGKRPVVCNAGSGFFYLDSMGEVFGCHILPGKMGNLRTTAWDDIWNGSAAEQIRAEASACHKCWMVCTSKSALRARLPIIAASALAGKVLAHVRSDPWA